MAKPNRNDPCPCGSGKKYKKCCLSADDNLDFRYRRWQRIEADLIPKLMEFAFHALGPEIFSEAWKVFVQDESSEEFDPAAPINMLFMPWFYFTWTVEVEIDGTNDSYETTVAELFLQDREDEVTSDEYTLLVNYARRPYSLCEIVDVKPGIGMTQLDLLRQVKYEVTERSASQTLKRGEILYCATTELDGIKSNIGTSPYPLRPIAKKDVLELRKWILTQIEEDEISEVELEEFEAEIRGLYLDQLASMFTPPKLTTTDGDPWIPHKVHFEIESPHKAFHQLKDLALEAATVPGKSTGSTRGSRPTRKKKAGPDFADIPLEGDLLKEATRQDGEIVKAEIPWLGGTEKARKRLGGTVLLGLLKIDGNRLVAEVNSKERALLVRKLIEERCEANATYKSTLVEPIDSAVEEMWEAAAAAQSGRTRTPQQDNSMSAGFGAGEEDNDAELREAMRAIKKRHQETWLDLPVPALANLTPREAANSEEGRELLESLLLDFEAHFTRDDGTGPDVAELRRELRLTGRSFKEIVSFINCQTGDDLIVSFACLKDTGDGIASLTLLRTPKYEMFFDEAERGVNVSHELDYSVERDLLKEVSYHRRRAVVIVQTESRTFELDVRKATPLEIKRMRNVLHKMNFDDSLQLLGI